MDEENDTRENWRPSPTVQTAEFQDGDNRVVPGTSALPRTGARGNAVNRSTHPALVSGGDTRATTGHNNPVGISTRARTIDRAPQTNSAAHGRGLGRAAVRSPGADSVLEAVARV